MSKEKMFGNTIYRDQVNGVKVVLSCHDLESVKLTDIKFGL